MIDRSVTFYCMLFLSIFFLLTAQPVSGGEAGTIDPSQEATNQEDATVEELRQTLSASNLKDFLAGVDPSEIILETGETLASVLLSTRTSTFDVSWYSFSSGGSVTEGGEFALIAAIGQAVAGETTAGEFSVMTGFGSGFQDLGIFSNGFETGDLSAWTNSTDN